MGLGGEGKSAMGGWVPSGRRGGLTQKTIYPRLVPGLGCTGVYHHGKRIRSWSWVGLLVLRLNEFDKAK